MIPVIAIGMQMAEERRQMLAGLFHRDVRLGFLAGLTGESREDLLRDASVYLAWSPIQELGAGVLRAFRNLRMIQLLSAGADHLPFSEIGQDILIASNVGAYAEPMAEHVLAMMLALGKNLLREHAELGRGEFNQVRRNRRFRGMSCGIIGFGGIGKAVAGLLRPLGMSIMAINSSGRTEEAVQFIGTLADLRTVLSRSDVIVITIPLTKAMRGMIGRDQLSWMKEDAILVNVARGAIVDQEALYGHLVSHPEFRAGMDAWWVEPFGDGRFAVDHPFFSLPNFLGSPHNSAITPGTAEHALQRAVENIERFLDGVPVQGIVKREDYL